MGRVRVCRSCVYVVRFAPCSAGYSWTTARRVSIAPSLELPLHRLRCCSLRLNIRMACSAPHCTSLCGTRRAGTLELLRYWLHQYLLLYEIHTPVTPLTTILYHGNIIRNMQSFAEGRVALSALVARRTTPSVFHGQVIFYILGER